MSTMDVFVDYAWNTCASLFILSVLTYLIPQLLLKFRAEQNLVKKYGLDEAEQSSKWALVTGGSSGIGRSIVEKLASQGMNVVVVAYPDKLLYESVAEYCTMWPSLEFKSIGLNLAGDFLAELVNETKELDISMVFNNAGYIKTGFFTQVPMNGQLANHHCNATAAVIITHHFVKLMQQKGIRGCVGFTSSPAGFMPCPFSSMYGATKAYLTEFAVSIAPELLSDGIDVCVVHPSPVASNFYEGTHQLDALLFFKSTATGPQKIASSLFQAMGRSVVKDQGYYPTCVKILLKIIDINFLADIITSTACMMPDYKAMKAENEQNNKKDE